MQADATRKFVFLVLPRQRVADLCTGTEYSGLWAGTEYSDRFTSRVIMTGRLVIEPVSIGDVGSAEPAFNSLEVMRSVRPMSVQPAPRKASDRAPSVLASVTFCASSLPNSSVTALATMAFSLRSSAC